ncbi:MAG: hypothetical protein EHM58_18955 [Ignavibacteriae bacterium]|nr:MAG: hypothetical protein EHM58_18955 [Ignavibacteriota bacterium]
MKKIFFLFIIFVFSFFYCSCSQKTDSSHKAVIKADKNFRISLPKNEYKLYEPILVRFDYINERETVDTIFFNFIDNYSNAVNFYVTSSSNTKLYNKKIHSFNGLVGESPQYFIEPKDTFILSMVLNRNNGDLASFENIYFGNFGYYPADEYKLYAEDKIGNYILRSNEVSFKIVALNDEDHQVLSFIKLKDYKKIFSDYPLNSFTEHAYAIYSTDELYPIVTRETDVNLVNSTFKDFITKFPDSYYCLNIGFANSYFIKVSNNTPSFEEAMKKVETFSQGTFFDLFIHQKTINTSLNKNFNRLKENIDRYNKLNDSLKINNK